MPTLLERVLSTLRGSAVALDDDQLAEVLGVRRQHVNQVARRLEARGQLSRVVDPQTGKIVNALRDPAEAAPVSALPEPSPAAVPTPASQVVLDALSRLARTRPIFHAEADFQHALAWELRAHAERIRLELRPLPDEALFLDLLVHGPLGRIAIELKYLTRAHRAEVDGDVFSLREQSAHDVRRYDVVKDVERLERLLAAGVADHGVAVVLTNVAAFWLPAAPRSTFDQSFRVHEGASLTGTLDWAPGTGDGTKKNRDKALVLRGSYRMSWVDYATVGTGPGSTFRALVVPVGS